MFAGGEASAAAEVQGDGGGVFEDRQPRLDLTGHRDQVPDRQQGAGGGGRESGFADEVAEVGFDDQLHGQAAVRGAECSVGEACGECGVEGVVIRLGEGASVAVGGGGQGVGVGGAGRSAG